MVVVGVVAGYVAMAALVILGVATAWLVLGAEAAFQAGSTVASLPWSVVQCGFGLIASLVGGCVATAVGRRATAPCAPVILLAGLIIALGLAMAIAQFGTEPRALPEGTAVSDLNFFEAGAVATSPAWYNFTIPVIGAVGALLGGKVIRLPKL